MSGGVLSVDVAPQPDGSWVVTSVTDAPAFPAFGQTSGGAGAAASGPCRRLHDLFLPIRTSLVGGCTKLRIQLPTA
jgi:hypothetical protein